MPTEDSTATRMMRMKSPTELKGLPNTPNRNAIFSTQEKQEPSMCMVAPRGSTISLTSLEMPVSSATSILVGMVATEEQVPRDVMAGRAIWRNISPTAPLPPPNQANRGKAVKM